MKRILVGVDGSENALRAVHFAAVLAKRFDAVVMLVHVITPSDHAVTSGKATFTDKETRVGGERLKAAEKILTDEGVVFRSQVEFGHPAEQLLMRSEGCELMVVGTRGLGPFKEALLGSISHRLTQISKVPVVIVP